MSPWTGTDGRYRQTEGHRVSATQGDSSSWAPPRRPLNQSKPSLVPRHASGAPMRRDRGTHWDDWGSVAALALRHPELTFLEVHLAG
jgi:hypothetical protein